MVNQKGDYFTGLLKIEESYKNHQAVPSEFKLNKNILNKSDPYYSKWQYLNPYLTWYWDLNLVNKAWTPILKPFTKTIQKTFKRVCYYPKSKDPLPKSFQKTGYWIKTTVEHLAKYLQSL